MTGRFSKENESRNVQASIDDFIDLIVFSPYGSFKADYFFGFVFQNTRFQISDTDDKIEDKKIQGDSFNKNNYANDLKTSIEDYETRIKRVRVSMSYDTDYKKVTIDVSGQYEEDYTEKMYKKNITFNIW